MLTAHFLITNEPDNGHATFVSSDDSKRSSRNEEARKRKKTFLPLGMNTRQRERYKSNPVHVVLYLSFVTSLLNEFIHKRKVRMRS